MNTFRLAIKRNAKLRLALTGPSGSGKTFSLLKLSTELAAASGGRIAYVDTEHGSASKYAHTDRCGGPGVCTAPDHFDFDVMEPDQFDPRELTKLIPQAAASGYTVMCIDSLSHYWMGVGGELELVDAVAKRGSRGSGEGNSFTAWKTVTPYHTALVDTIISAPLHVLVSMRSRTEWVIEKNDQGKSVPRKLGTEAIMRSGIDFEFDIAGDMDQDNNLIVSKSRCSALSGKVINRPGKDTAQVLIDWLAGAPEEVKPAPSLKPAVAPLSPSPVQNAEAAVVTDEDIPRNMGGLYDPPENPADQLKANARAALNGTDRPWKTKGEMRELFERARTKLMSFDDDPSMPFGESIFHTELRTSKVERPEYRFSTSEAALECYERIQQRITTLELTAHSGPPAAAPTEATL